MNSTRPYLIRAFYQWIVDNDCTPYVVVDAEKPGVSVPEQHVEDGKIVLNVSHRAVQKLNIDNEAIEFVARFSGVSTPIYAAMPAIIAIYAKENGRGMVFTEDDEEDPPSGGTPPDRGKPVLKVVK